MKLNHMADWSDEEYENILGLKHPSEYDDSDIVIPDAPQTDDYEPVDWRNKGAVTAVKDRSKWISPTSGQKEYCAGSYAVATAEVLEGYQYLSKKKLLEVSVQQILDCSSNASLMSKTGTTRWNEGCAGGYFENAFEFATEYEVFDE